MPDPTCNQEGCDEPGAYRYTWPGKDEAHICEGHAAKLRTVAAVMGLTLQMIPVTTEEPDHA